MSKGIKVSFTDDLVVKVLDTCAIISDEGILKFKDDGLHIYAVNKATTMMFYAHVSKDLFLPYIIDQSQDLTIDIKKAKQMKWFEKMKSGYEGMLSLEDNKMNVSFNKDTTTKTSKLFLINRDTEIEEIEEFDFQNIYDIDLPTFIEWLKDIITLTDYVNIVTTDNSLRFLSYIPKVSIGEITIEEMFESSLHLKVIKSKKEQGNVVYNINYLLDLVSNFKGRFEKINLSFQNDLPIIGMLKDEFFIIKFFVAPRESED